MTTSDDSDRDELLKVYLGETEENLTLLEEMLVLLEVKADDEEVINAVFRAAHTLKGNAAMLGFDGLARLAHSMEDLLDEVRAKRFAVSSGLITLLLRGRDAFRQMLPAAVDGSNELSSAAASVIAELDRTKKDGLRESAATATVEETADAAIGSGQRLRVDLQRLDVILDLTSELSIASGRLFDGIGALAEVIGDRLASPAEDVERILEDLQQQVTRVRMVPIGPRFEQQRRNVRDLAQAAGKPIRLVIEGRNVEIDASLVQQIKDPLTHIVRNAVDHGIEQPDVRRARGKDPVATLTLRAYQDGASVVVEVKDDGGGFDRQRILERARERGMVAAGATPSNEEIDALVFAPGFSTAEAVTEVSGRGVGMDVVARTVAAMRGTVRIESRPGTGTSIIMRLPLTLAILSGLVVQAGGERFVVPMDAIAQCEALPAGEPRHTRSGLFEWRDEAVPYIRLKRLFALPNGAEPPVEQIVLIQSELMTVGIVADDLLGEMQAVIKPLGNLFRRAGGVSASTIFPDGRVGLILDVPGLVRRVMEEQAA
jgi:two-component system chemotaxis sensor kinase CheA